jgi:hypothetical protein
MNGRRGLVSPSQGDVAALRHLLHPTFACLLKLFTKDAVSCAVEFQRITLSVVVGCD